MNAPEPNVHQEMLENEHRVRPSLERVIRWAEENDPEYLVAGFDLDNAGMIVYRTSAAEPDAYVGLAKGTAVRFAVSLICRSEKKLLQRWLNEQMGALLGMGVIPTSLSQHLPDGPMVMTYDPVGADPADRPVRESALQYTPAARHLRFEPGTFSGA